MPTVAQRRRDLRNLPWRLVRQVLRIARQAYWSQPRPTGTYLRVETDPHPITKALGERFWYPNWEVSAYYEGEDLNLSRTEYDPHEGIVWWQSHLRGWETDDAVELRAHYEPDPTEHPREHLTPAYADAETGMTHLRDALDDAGFSYREFEYR
jgi:hypothetical protein